MRKIEIEREAACTAGHLGHLAGRPIHFQPAHSLPNPSARGGLPLDPFLPPLRAPLERDRERAAFTPRPDSLGPATRTRSSAALRARPHQCLLLLAPHPASSLFPRRRHFSPYRRSSMEAAASTSGSGLRRPLPPRPWPRPRLPRPELPLLRLGQEVPHGRLPPSLSASVEPGRRAPPSPAVVSGRCRRP